MWKLLASVSLLLMIAVGCYSCVAEQEELTEEQQLRITKWRQYFSEESWNPYCWQVLWDSEMKGWAEGITVPPSPPPNDPALGKEANPDWPWLPGQKPPYPKSKYPGVPAPDVTSMSWDTELGEWHTHSETEGVE